MFEKFRIKVTILASLIVTAYCFFSSTEFLKTGYTIILTIITFYILGGVVELEVKSHLEKIAILAINQKNNITDIKENENFQKNENFEEFEDDNSMVFEEDDFYNEIDFEDDEAQETF